MDVPVQIAFHHAAKPEWIEEELRARAARLESMEPRLVGCRITVDQRADNPGHTIPPVVRIELDMPGTAPLIVAHEPDRLQQKYQAPDLRTAVHDAFSIAERQLESWKEQRNSRTKSVHHDAQNQYLGQVAEVHAEGDYGFLMSKEGSLLYFHRNSLLSGQLEDLRIGDEVHYVETIGDTGPLAVKIRAA